MKLKSNDIGRVMCVMTATLVLCSCTYDEVMMLMSDDNGAQAENSSSDLISPMDICLAKQLAVSAPWTWEDGYYSDKTIEHIDSVLLADNSMVYFGSFHHIPAIIVDPGGPNETRLDACSFSSENYYANTFFLSKFDEEGELIFATTVLETDLFDTKDYLPDTTGDWQDEETLRHDEYERDIMTLHALSDGGLVIGALSAKDETTGAKTHKIAKYSKDGDLSFTIDLPGQFPLPDEPLPDGSPPYRKGFAIVDVLDDDAIVAIGLFQGEAIFGAGQPNETVLNSDAEVATYVARFDALGNILSAHMWSKNDHLTDMKVTPSGDLLVSYRSGEIAMLTEGGDVKWQGHLNPPVDLSATDYRDFIPRVTIAPDGSILIGRKYVSPLTISDDTGNEVQLNGTAATNGPWYYPYPLYFIARFSEGGELLWARTSPDNSLIDNAEVDVRRDFVLQDDGTFFLQAWVHGTVDFETGDGSEIRITSRGENISNDENVRIYVDYYEELIAQYSLGGQLTGFQTLLPPRVGDIDTFFMLTGIHPAGNGTTYWFGSSRTPFTVDLVNGSQVTFEKPPSWQGHHDITLLQTCEK